MFNWKRIFGKQVHVDEINATLAMLRVHKIQCMEAARLISETSDKIRGRKGNEKFAELLVDLLEVIRLRRIAAEQHIKLGESHLAMFKGTGIQYTDFVADVERIEKGFQDALQELANYTVK